MKKVFRFLAIIAIGIIAIACTNGVDEPTAPAGSFEVNLSSVESEVKRERFYTYDLAVVRGVGFDGDITVTLSSLVGSGELLVDGVVYSAPVVVSNGVERLKVEYMPFEGVDHKIGVEMVSGGIKCSDDIVISVPYELSSYVIEITRPKSEYLKIVSDLPSGSGVKWYCSNSSVLNINGNGRSCSLIGRIDGVVYVTAVVDGVRMSAKVSSIPFVETTGVLIEVNGTEYVMWDSNSRPNDYIDIVFTTQDTVTIKFIDLIPANSTLRTMRGFRGYVNENLIEDENCITNEDNTGQREGTWDDFYKGKKLKFIPEERVSRDGIGISIKGEFNYSGVDWKFQYFTRLDK